MSYGSDPHKPQVLLHDRFEILRRTRAVEDAAFALVHEVVLLAVDRELVHRGVADDDRRIDQRVEVGRDDSDGSPPAVRQRRQRRFQPAAGTMRTSCGAQRRRRG